MKPGFTAENVAMIPFAEEEAALIKADFMIDLSYRYFVVGRTFTGARFYSENLDWDETAEMFNKYVATVSWFGGGTVVLYEKILGDVVEVRSTWVN